MAGRRASFRLDLYQRESRACSSDNPSFDLRICGYDNNRSGEGYKGRGGGKARAGRGTCQKPHLRPRHRILGRDDEGESIAEKAADRRLGRLHRLYDPDPDLCDKWRALCAYRPGRAGPEPDFTGPLCGSLGDRRPCMSDRFDGSAGKEYAVRVRSCTGQSQNRERGRDRQRPGDCQGRRGDLQYSS